jgi:pyridoxine 5-phosphate synthase
VCRLKPDQATFVPERREEVTTEGGLDLSRRDERLAAAIDKVRKAGVHVSLFIDPTPAAIRASAELGAPAVELHTGRYSHTWRQGPDALEQLRAAAVFARQLGLRCTPGMDSRT